MPRVLSAAGLLAGVLILSNCHSAPSTNQKLEAFRRLPPDRIAAWQVDTASLRRSLLPLPKEADGADLISGIVTPARKVIKIAEPPALPPAGAGAVPDIAAIPADAQFWLVGDPSAISAALASPKDNRWSLTFGKTTVELPSALLDHASKIAAWGKASPLGGELTVNGEYPSDAEAADLASSLSAVLRLSRDVKATAKAEGSHIVIHATIGPAETAKLLLNWIESKADQKH